MSDQLWSGLRMARPTYKIVIGFDATSFTFAQRLWAVLTIPYQLVRFVVTGHFAFCEWGKR